MLSGLADVCAPSLAGVRCGMVAGLLALGLLTLGTLTADAQTAGKSDPSLKTSGQPKKPFKASAGQMFGPPQKLDKSQPLYLQGDQLVYDTKGNRVIARGNVEIFYNNNILTADEVIYDQSANTLTAVGNVMLKDPNGNVTRSNRFTLTDDFRDGFAETLNIVSKDKTRISAQRADRRDGTVTEYKRGKFTPCKSEGGMPPLWCISAATIVHDHVAQTLTYQDATFDFFGYPIAYFPYFQHADPTVKRRSGFLMPEFGHSTTLGWSTEIPYYYVLANNMDFTFHPRYWSKQGVLWQGDFRHKLAGGEYTVKIAGLEQDSANLPLTMTAADRARLDGWRGSVETKGQFSLASWWKFGWDVTVESDDTFRRFYKLDNILQNDRINQIYLTGLSERNYFSAKFYQFGGLTFDGTPLAESWVHPIIDYHYIVGQPVLGGELSFTANALSFSRNDATSTGRFQSMNKVTAEVDWRRKLTDQVGITYTPFGQARGDIYQIENFVDPATGNVVADTTVVRGITAAGVTVEYPWVANAGGASHIVSPIGQVITRQASIDQRHMPDEDAKSIVFDDTNLFELQKFSGYDRIETGTRANVGVQYTFQANNGPYARILAGQSFHLAGENAYANPGTDYDINGKPIFNPLNGLEKTRSDYVLGVYLAPSQVFRIVSQTRFNENDFALEREDLAASLRYGPVQLGAYYTYSAANTLLGVPVAQQDLTATASLRADRTATATASLAITDHWSISGSLRYDLDAGKILTDTLQLKYSDECFMVAAVYSETFINDPARYLAPDRSIMFRFAWKYLGEYHYATNVLDNVMTSNAQ